MIDEITSLFTGHEILILVIVLSITFFATEITKQAIRKWTPLKTDNLIPRLIAFSIGFAVTVFAWPAASKVNPYLMGVFIGFSNPALYRLVRWKWPKLTAIATGKKPTESPDNPRQQK